MTKKMEDIAGQAAVNTPRTFRRKEIEGELNFISDLDALDAALEADNIVARFENPNGGDPIDFEMRQMTPGEFSAYYNTLLGNTLLEAAAENLPNPDTELDDAQQEKLQDELAVKKYDERLLNILEGCIQSPAGVTAERMRNWDPFYIMSLHNALMTGSRPRKAVARFSDVDTAGTEQG